MGNLRHFGGCRKDGGRTLVDRLRLNKYIRGPTNSWGNFIRTAVLGRVESVDKELP